MYLYTNECDYPGNCIHLRTAGVYERGEGISLQVRTKHYYDYLKMCRCDGTWLEAYGRVSGQKRITELEF